MQVLMQNTHDALRRDLLDKIRRSGDYSYPETESGYVSGVFEAEPNLEMLADFCQYVTDAGKTVYDGEWSADDLFSFLEPNLRKYHSGDSYSIMLSFGSILPPLALLPFLSVYSQINAVDIKFLHDKWEARGDYSAKKHVGITLDSGKVVATILPEHSNSVKKVYPPKAKISHDSENGHSMRQGISTDVNIEYKDKIFVLTGFDEKEEKKLTDLIVANGGLVKSSVVLATNYLVVNLNYKGAATTKYKRAVELIEKGKEIYIVAADQLLPEMKNAPSARHIHSSAQAARTDVETIYLWSEVRDDVEVVYENKVFVLTMFTAAEENTLKEHITARGGIVKDRMVSNADYLVVGPRQGAYETQKYTQAVEMMRKGKAIRIVAFSTVLPSLDPTPRQNRLKEIYRTESGTFVAVDGQLISCKTTKRYVKIPNGIKKIGDCIFLSHDYIQTVVIPGSVTEIGKSAFAHCWHLTKVLFSQGLKKIHEEAFACCDNLEYVDLPDSLTEIGDKAFDGCYMRAAVIPKDIASIGYRAFSCNLIAAAITDSEVESYGELKKTFTGIAIDGVIYSLDKKTLLYYPQQRKRAKFVVPEFVENIGDFAFKGADYLKQVILPKGILRIGESAFAYCSVLESIDLPEGLVEIGNGAFLECDKLPDVAFPESLKKIGDRAFKDCKSFTKVIIPQGVETIGNGAFEGCYAVNEIQVLGAQTQFEVNALPFVFKTQMIYIAQDHYKYTAVADVLYSKDGKTLLRYLGNKEAERFVVPDGVEVIVRDAFSFIKNLIVLSSISFLYILSFCPSFPSAK